jgi:hypothetical protein
MDSIEEIPDMLLTVLLGLAPSEELCTHRVEYSLMLLFCPADTPLAYGADNRRKPRRIKAQSRSHRSGLAGDPTEAALRGLVAFPNWAVFPP